MAISLLRPTSDDDLPHDESRSAASGAARGSARHAAPNVVRGASAASGVAALSVAECHALLARHRLCVLAAVDGDMPYAVPMFYGWDPAAETLFLGISEGRKTHVLDENPELALTVAEVGAGDTWASVMVSGRAEWVTEPVARAAAVQVLMAHNRRLRDVPPDAPAAAPAAADAAPSPARRHGGGRIVRVVGAVITGRAKR